MAIAPRYVHLFRSELDGVIRPLQEQTGEDKPLKVAELLSTLSPDKQQKLSRHA